MKPWLIAALSAFLDWLGTALAYTLAGLTILGILALIVMIEIEKYKEERRKESV